MNGILVRRAMNTRELERYERLLIAKREELSPSHLTDAPLVMGAGGPQGDLVDQANADAEAERRMQEFAERSENTFYTIDIQSAEYARNEEPRGASQSEKTRVAGG